MLVSFVALLPIVWVVMTSFKSDAVANTYPPMFIFEPTISTYSDALTGGLLRFFLNSLIVAAASVTASFAIGLPAAYALARISFRGNQSISFWIISTRMGPPFGFIIPFYLIMSNIHLLDTWTALIVMYLIFNLPFMVWMLKGFIQESPKEIEESAMIDGCSTLGALGRVVLPTIKPGIAATIILSFVAAWNEFMYAVALTSTQAKTLPVATSDFSGSFVTGLRWNLMSVYATASMLPVLVMSIFVQRYLVRGLTLGALKG